MLQQKRRKKGKEVDRKKPTRELFFTLARCASKPKSVWLQFIYFFPNFEFEFDFGCNLFGSSLLRCCTRKSARKLWNAVQ
jgi:hypothetical protein